MPSQAARSIIIPAQQTLLSIDGINNICSSSSDGPPLRGYPAAFPVVFEHLPILANALNGVIERLTSQNPDADSSEDIERYQLVMQHVQGCSNDASKLWEMFQQMVCGPGNVSTRAAHYSEMARSVGTVEVLMKKMLASIRTLAESPLRVIKEDEQRKLDSALEAISKLPSSLADARTGSKVFHITNAGPGFLPTHIGDYGNQYNSGHIFSGTYQHPLNLYPPNPQNNGTG